MKKLKLAFACAAASLAACAFAQEEEEGLSPSSTAASAAELGVKVPEKPKTKWFYTLPLCRRVEGNGEVQPPGSSVWSTIEEGRFYPLGSSYRASENSKVIIAFGKECLATIENGASFATRAQGLGTGTRTLVLTGGTVSLSLSGNLEPGLFSVTTPAFTVVNPAGESKYEYRAKPDGFEADVRCVTGSLEVDGRHFKAGPMNAADMLTIRSEHDNLQTILYGRSGDFVVRLDRGIVAREEIQDDGTVKLYNEPGWLDWNLSVSTRVQISRAVPAIGSRMSVTMMTFDSVGEMKNHFAFTEGRAEVNSGELVSRPKSDSDDIAKRAAEVTNEAAAEETEEATVEDTPAEATSTESTTEDDDF